MNKKIKENNMKNLNNTTLKEIISFMNYYNNQHKIDEKGNVPFNEYALCAVDTGFGYCHKWFISKNNFKNLKKEILETTGLEESDFMISNNRMFLIFDEDNRVEIEIDTHGFVEAGEEVYNEISNILK